MTTILNNETSRKQYAYTYITRSIYQSIVYVFSKIIYIFDICDATDEEKATVEANIRHIDNHLDDIQAYINETKTKQRQTTDSLNEDGIAFDKKITNSEKVIDYYRKIISKLKAGEEGRTKMVVVDCIFTILDNGIATAFPMTLLFIIFFLIFMFIPVGF
jgi:septal ring factor EnvC (AmiA/AmiB activator)